MPSGWRGATIEDLEQALAQAAPFVAFPETGDLSGVVARRIREVPLPTRRWALPSLRELLRPAARPILQPAWLKATVALAVAVMMFTGTLVFSPSARHAVAGWLGLRGVRIQIVPSPSITLQPPALGAGLELGDRVTLAEAQPQVPFEILFPAQLGPPDEIYLRTDLAVDEVTLVYRARPGLPAAAATGEGLLIGEFQAGIDNQLIEKKVGSQATVIEPVNVNGQPGYWIEGAHEVYLIGPDGEQLADTVRLAGNVLLWEKGKVTLRLEADVSKGQALRIARSVG